LVLFPVFFALADGDDRLVPDHLQPAIAGIRARH
jgi:hypothetical protein